MDRGVETTQPITPDYSSRGTPVSGGSGGGYTYPTGSQSSNSGNSWFSSLIGSLIPAGAKIATARYSVPQLNPGK
jgi:hypothetical protein